MSPPKLRFHAVTRGNPTGCCRFISRNSACYRTKTHPEAGVRYHAHLVNIVMTGPA